MWTLALVPDMPTVLTPVDDGLTSALRAERDRQRETLSLIASENYASEAVLAAQGTVLTSKYAEGTPGERYYGGCEHVGAVERLAQERARETVRERCRAFPVYEGRDRLSELTPA